jgi:regulator of sigma E protease
MAGAWPLNIVMTFLYFMLALLLLVSVHEFGHFWVARRLGVKVLRFSFGFGKVLARWHAKSGTEYVWSLLPFGGYVQMLDEEEGPVADADKPFAFNRQSAWVKIAIAFAGPLFNFIFAFCALWLVLVVGIQSLAPMIDNVLPGSVAAKAGLVAQQEIVAMNHQPISSWRDFQYALMPFIGTSDTVSLTVKSMVNGESSTASLALVEGQLDGKNPDLLATLGIKPFVPKIPPLVGEVVNNSPAQLAGFKTGDEVLVVDGVAIKDWLNLLELIKHRPHQDIPMMVKRQGQVMQLHVKLGSVEINGHEVGLLGIRSQPQQWPTGWLRLQRLGPIEAVGTAFKQTVQLTESSILLMGRLVLGKVSLHGISGPVGIAQIAGASARNGFAYYVFFLAIISISLGVLNLLPIPLLDGGHILYYFCELIRRRPLSTEIKTIGLYIGFIMLMGLMVLAVTNDLERLIHGGATG